LIAWFTGPISTLVAGPLADYVMEPSMQAGGSLTGLFGSLTGIGPGSGMSLMFVFTGLLVVCVGLGGYLVPAIRNAELILPDHDAAPTASEA
jgi:DHA3 family macrolide efflux protein-like MFS transporter